MIGGVTSKLDSFSRVEGLSIYSDVGTLLSGNRGNCYNPSFTTRWGNSAKIIYKKWGIPKVPLSKGG